MCDIKIKYCVVNIKESIEKSCVYLLFIVNIGYLEDDKYKMI